MPPNSPLQALAALPTEQSPAHARAQGWRRFERLIVALAAALGVAAGCALGNWQLNRAAQKTAIAAAIAERAALRPLSATELLARAAEPGLRYRRVELSGTWQADKTVLLENRQMNGQPGFFVMTPLQLADASATVLVQRGWLPRDIQQRTRLAPYQTAAGRVSIVGTVAPPPPKLYALGAPQTGLIRQNLDLAAFAVENPAAGGASSVAPLVTTLTILQTGDATGASDGLKRAWPEIQSGVAKHHGYAFQWFGLAALIAGLYVWFQFFRRAKQRG
jgi:surfeit locus 1 family protein